MIRYDFAGKVALVTGSSRGIGAAILESFARAGATCILHFFDDEGGGNRKDAESHGTKLRSLGATVHTIVADVRNPDQVQKLMADIKSQAGGLDIIVNNAGVLRDRTIRKLTLDDWRFVMDVNLDGVFHCCKQAVETLRDNGRIVNIASIAGLFPFHGQANYAAAKAGVIALTKVLAKELARRGITANAIAPGVIQTSMIGDIKPDVLEGYLKQIPVGRLGKPEDVANAVLFLASDESSYITGQVLPVTGGWF
ncbi:MAG TPA: 3-oxoacyl-ACP reductase family protein [Gemmataceae bacterium]|jgi:3-oxoacyl-[acyl-carrier protein] reductase|nr:3-oxoacyl-ACP reductase family protein [Gemmataceae bacterium]